MIPPAGRVVMVSGANRGIGRAIAERLHAEGYALSLGARDGPALAAAGRGLAPERTYAHPFEARDRASPAAWVAATVARYGRLDGLVNNAGIDHPVGIEDEDETAIDELWEVNVKGPLRLIRAALPHLRASGCGRIVNIASLSGKRVRDLHVGYAMSKFAVMALTHTARRVAWDSGVRATAVCPGLVDTEMTADYVASVPREQMTQAGDLAHLVATALALPNHACVAELLVNYRLDDLF